MIKILKLIFLPFLWLIYLTTFLIKRNKYKIITGSITDAPPSNLVEIQKKFIQEGFDIVFVGNKYQGINTIKKYSIKFFVYALTSKYYIYTHYPSDVNFWLSGGAKYINIWHGHPLKHIERDYQKSNFFNIPLHRKILRILYNPYQYITNFKILCHFDKYRDIFKSAFGVNESNIINCKEIRQNPKNPEDLDILYLPTFRPEPLKNNHYKKIRTIINFFENNNLDYKFKLHPHDRGIELNINNMILDHQDPFDFYSTTKILIADYSSVVIDYISANKNPKVILFLHDEHEYRELDRDFYDIWDGIKSQFYVVDNIRDIKNAIVELNNDNLHSYDNSFLKPNVRSLDINELLD